MIMHVFPRRLPALVATAIVAAACAACGSTVSATDSKGTVQSHSQAGFPVTVTTADGPLRLKTRPTAIISLSPTATEMLYAIGAGSQVKAVDEDSDYPSQAPRTKLNGFAPNVEAIAGYQPDLVVTSFDGSKLAKGLAPLGIPVLNLPAATTVSQEYAEFDQLGQATGHLTQAQHEDASLRSQISAIVAATPRQAKPLTYYYELDTTYYSVTSDTFVGKLLALLGMRSIADDAKGVAAAGGYPQLSAEYIVKANPDFIILADTGNAGGQDAATVSARPGWSALTAVKDKHIIALNADIASRWGPRITQLLQAVASALKAQS
jgi:iron complex transport system substrate-binding protein